MSNGYKDLGDSAYPAKYDHDDSTAGELLPCHIIDGAFETLTAASPAVSVDCYLTKLDATSNGVASTLADGKFHGQMKRIVANVVSGGTTNVTIASPFSAGTNLVTFAAVGDYCDLIWSEAGGYWRIIGTGNEAAGTAGPTPA